MESENAVRIEEACRFCWMCRHLCPVALATGSEANTPRGRALNASMDRRGVPFGKGSAEKMFECVLCYACTDNCATGYDPTVFTRELRGRAIAEGLAGERIQGLAAELMDGGNPFVVDEEDGGYDAAVKDLPSSADVLLYRGGYMKHALPLIKLLKREKVDFTIRSDEKASGAAMWDFIGYVEEVRDAAAEWVSWLDGQGASTVVCLDPQDVFFYREQAAKWDIKAKCSIVTPIEFVSDLAGKGRMSIRKNALKAVYHDPTVYARNLMDTETPRNLLKEAGVDVKELFLHGHLARSSGSRILRRIDPDLQAKVAKGLWDDIIALGSDAVVTSSPSTLCNLEESAPDGMKVLDIFEVL